MILPYDANVNFHYMKVCIFIHKVPTMPVSYNMHMCIEQFNVLISFLHWRQNVLVVMAVIKEKRKREKVIMLE